jgi:shikimate dehydrogenase
VLGDPVEHSRSPRIHAAAYAAMGLDWRYDAIRQTVATLPGFLDDLDAAWRGLSVTAPLKEAAATWVDDADELVALTGACNTVRPDLRRGWNTDVGGIVDAFADAGVDAIAVGGIVGGGATAVSALVALQRMGARRVHVWMRTPAKGARLVALGQRLGVDVTIGDPASAVPGEAIVSTLPASASVVPHLVAPAAILDADYASGASRFDGVAPVVPGLQMLLHQALAQVRIFVHGDPAAALDDEAAAWSAMRAAV